MLRENFPDWQERVAYQNKKLELVRSGLTRMAEVKRVKKSNSFQLTPEERDAFDYFSGKGFYQSYQNLSTPFNIFDTRKSFLLKMEDKEMRDRFLEIYNRKQVKKQILP